MYFVLPIASVPIAVRFVDEGTYSVAVGRIGIIYFRVPPCAEDNCVICYTQRSVARRRTRLWECMKKFSAIAIVLLTVVLSVVLAACKPVALSAPSGLAYEDGVLSWEAVEGAEEYIVEVDGAEVARVKSNHYAYAAKGQATFRVAAVGNAKRYLDSEFCEPLVYKPVVDNRATLTTPTVIEVNGEGILRWSYVVNATGYRIYLNGNVVATVGQETQYALSIADTGAFTVQVQAVGGAQYHDSARSATYRVEASGGKIKAPALSAPDIAFDIATHRVTWPMVSHALAYDVYQNGVRVGRIAADNASSREVSGSSYRYFYSPYINVRNTRLSVVAIADGEVYADSPSSNVLAFPLIASGVPSGLTETVADGTIYLTWDKVENCSGYKVKVESGDTVISTHSTSQNRIALSLPDGTYQVSVAGDGDGYLFNPTDYSAQYEITFAGGKPTPLTMSAPQNPYLYKKVVRFTQSLHAASYQVLVDTPYDDLQGAYTFDITVGDTADGEGAEFEIPVYLHDTVLTIYLRAIGESGYGVSLWSTGVCYYPVNEEEDLDEYLEKLKEQEEEGQGGEEGGASGEQEGEVQPDEEGGEGESPAPVVYPNYSVVAIPVGFGFAQGALSWNEIAGAYGYELVVDGNPVVLHENTYALDASVPHICKIRTLAEGQDVLDSPYTAELYVESLGLSAPADVRVKGTTLSWSSVSGAAAYLIQINGGETVRLSSATLDLSKQLTYDGAYTLRVMATSAYPYYRDSLYSETVSFVVDYEESGTEHKPYLLSEAADLALLDEHPTAYFALVGNIAVGETAPLFGPKNAFAGAIDGRGYALTDIRVTGDGTANGLFGCLYGAVLTNITFEFAEVTLDTAAPCGVLAGEAVQCIFDGVTLTATLTADKAFGTVGNSTECVYRRSQFNVNYTQTTATQALGGVVAKSIGDLFDRVTVSGSLSGGVYMGALAATVADGTVEQCVIGTAETPFAYGVNNGYAGAVGKGNLAGCTATVYAEYTLGGNCYAGAFGGQLTCPAVSGRADVTYRAAADLVYIGGAVGYSTVDVADVAVTMRLEGNVRTLYAGGVTGYAQGLCVCADTTFVALTVDLDVTDGRYLGGVVGFGTGTYGGAPTGNISVGASVSVGRIMGTSPTESEEGWVLTPKE